MESVEKDNLAQDHQLALQTFTKDLNALAEKGHLDPVIGRDKEIRRVIQVLSRRRKNNPVLIGEPGVGKTAIVEGLALRIVNKDVPDVLVGKRVLSLDIGLMLAGAMYRGQFESRLKALIQAIEDQSGEVILFIDELHNLVGAGKIDGALDAGQMLKPALARGELRAIGATTLDEYRKFIEKDRALERRFQTILVEEPSVEDAITILRGLKEKYEVHHGVHIKDPALVQAVKLSHRYISDRYLPDKAIDLLDEATSKINIEAHSVPAELDELRRKILNLKVEKKSLGKEEGSKDRSLKIEEEIQKLEEENRLLSQNWEKSRAHLMNLKESRQKLEQIKVDMERAERDGNLQKVAELKYGEMPLWTQKLQNLQKNQQSGILKEDVGEDEIAEVVSRWTGIPVERMLKKQAQKLLEMEAHLSQTVVGQTEALSKISDAVRRSRSGISDPHRPIGVFMFLGPTGVGKTQTARSLAQFLFDSDQKITRIDMSEYGEKHTQGTFDRSPSWVCGI